MSCIRHGLGQRLRFGSRIASLYTAYWPISPDHEFCFVCTVALLFPANCPISRSHFHRLAAVLLRALSDQVAASRTQVAIQFSLCLSWILTSHHPPLETLSFPYSTSLPDGLLRLEEEVSFERLESFTENAPSVASRSHDSITRAFPPVPSSVTGIRRLISSRPIPVSSVAPTFCGCRLSFTCPPGLSRRLGRPRYLKATVAGSVVPAAPGLAPLLLIRMSKDDSGVT